LGLQIAGSPDCEKLFVYPDAGISDPFFRYLKESRGQSIGKNNLTETEQRLSKSEIELAELQAKIAIVRLNHEEAMDKQERMIEAKIDRLEPLSPEEQVFYTKQVSKRKEANRERIAEALEDIANQMPISAEEEE
jgi:hypothetical protein